MRAVLLVIALMLAVTGCTDDQVPPPSNADDLPSLTPTTTDATDPTDGSASPGASNTPSPGVPPREAKAARRTFETWFDAFASGDGDRACPLQTQRFTQQQIQRLAKDDRIRPGASCGDLVDIVGILFEAIRLDADDATVSRAPSQPDQVAFSVVFRGLASLGYALIATKNGWRIDQDLTAN